MQRSWLLFSTDSHKTCFPSLAKYSQKQLKFLWNSGWKNKMERTDGQRIVLLHQVKLKLDRLSRNEAIRLINKNSNLLCKHGKPLKLLLNLTFKLDISESFSKPKRFFHGLFNWFRQLRDKKTRHLLKLMPENDLSIQILSITGFSAIWIFSPCDKERKTFQLKSTLPQQKNQHIVKVKL